MFVEKVFLTFSGVTVSKPSTISEISIEKLITISSSEKLINFT